MKLLNKLKTKELIFRKGSKTYFYSTLFFPKNLRPQIFTLYAFVRTADNFVDQTPQDRSGFIQFRHEFESTWTKNNSLNPIIADFVELAQKCEFPKEWVDAFLNSMEMDLTPHVYETLAETQRYIYGSGEVIGLMMAKLLKLPHESFPSAQLLGRAMQYVNFIRDIAEDEKLNRNYFPREELSRFGLVTASRSQAELFPLAFDEFIRQQIKRYFTWQNEAEKGFRFIPKRFRIPIETASAMYRWTAEEIYENPKIVFAKKIKPSVFRILKTGISKSVN